MVELERGGVDRRATPDRDTDGRAYMLSTCIHAITTCMHMPCHAVSMHGPQRCWGSTVTTSSSPLECRERGVTSSRLLNRPAPQQSRSRPHQRARRRMSPARTARVGGKPSGSRHQGAHQGGWPSGSRHQGAHQGEGEYLRELGGGTQLGAVLLDQLDASLHLPHEARGW